LISASITTFSHYNLKILRPKFKKILRIGVRSFENPHPGSKAAANVLQVSVRRFLSPDRARTDRL